MLQFIYTCIYFHLRIITNSKNETWSPKDVSHWEKADFGYEPPSVTFREFR